MIQSSRLSSYVTGDFSRYLTSGPKGGQEGKDVAGTRVINSGQASAADGGLEGFELEEEEIAADG